ncbi:hypothetical protein BDV27DRAFT_155269 [Aspergillus caelatus]|uniref:Uncharacterized protein n=1 Tax=Aspergillus caelatus TaxID=61420 RepID=A0A5N7ABY8_9EURO|nr:uncharacterized protein BDV27DRAFT_155269 [Aspergillus caelatus]KAE8367173.1 hypothetical protein BDV27DRAFT_155269 [Aspergillus caelatus]
MAKNYDTFVVIGLVTIPIFLIGVIFIMALALSGACSGRLHTHYLFCINPQERQKERAAARGSSDVPDITISPPAPCARQESDQEKEMTMYLNHAVIPILIRDSQFGPLIR